VAGRGIQRPANPHGEIVTVDDGRVSSNDTIAPRPVAPAG